MIVGVLLAAGQSTRFGADKLIQPLPNGMPMVCAAARNLEAGADRVIVVIRPGHSVLRYLLAHEKVDLLECADAESGMGCSIACAVRASRNAMGWLIALGDMPFIQAATIEKVGMLLRANKAIVAPEYNGKRGHPVGFSNSHFQSLSTLHDDGGARKIISCNVSDLHLFSCGDPGVLQDIDTLSDFTLHQSNA